MNHFSKYYNKIFDYSLKKGTHIKFIDILKTYPINHKDKILLTTKHIYNELPIRLANRVTDLNNLPFGLSKNHSIHNVREWYLMSCLELFDLKEPKTNEEIEQYRNTIEKIYNRHSTTLLTVTKGLYELKKENKISDIEEPTMQKFLNRFYTNRTEIRILLEHYLALFEQNNNKKHFGIVNLECYPYKIVEEVVENIQYICDKNRIPLRLEDIVKIDIDKHFYLPSINSYLYYIFFELIKNSVKAVIENDMNILDPKILISIRSIDKNILLIKIKDNGIGIKEEDKDKIWYYSYSSSKIDINDILEDKDFSISTPLSGFGYGLPITDIYIQFFNKSVNNIKIESIYKEGTSIFIFLKNYQRII